MSSNIKINIVEPGSSTPIDPAVPNTGLFTHGIGGPEATIITVSIVVVIAIIVAAALYYKKKHNKDSKTNKATKLANTISAVKTKKKLSIPLASLALVVSLGTLAALLVNTGKSNTSAAEDEQDNLTVTESSEDLTIEVGDEPVFAVLPVELTVAEATVAGYTLTAYTEDTNLVSTTDNTKIIPMVAADEGELVALADDTYGLSLSEPEDKDSEVYTTLSTNQDTPTILKTIDDYSPTEAEDETTIYYGFYITPDIPYGTYEGSSIYYEAEPNHITTLCLDGNGSDGGTAMQSMTIIAGDTITLPANTYTKDGYHFTGWNTAADGTGEAYADEAEFTASTSETQDITLYAQWEEDILYMQDVATWKDTLTIDKTVIALDNRDGKEYTVAKLRDGKVWMTQNLDLQKEDLLAGVTLDSTNTDHPAAEFVLPDSQTSGSDSWGSGQAAINNAHVFDPNDRNGYAARQLGNYYNWRSATAGTGSTGGQAAGSICPAGWRLPTGNVSKSTAIDYSTLLHAYDVIDSTTSPYNTNSSKLSGIFESPISLVGAGRYSSGAEEMGTTGYLWTSEAYYSSACIFYFYNTYVNPWYNLDRGNGYSIRCVAE